MTTCNVTTGQADLSMCDWRTAGLILWSAAREHRRGLCSLPVQTGGGVQETDPGLCHVVLLQPPTPQNHQDQ